MQGVGWGWVEIRGYEIFWRTWRGGTQFVMVHRKGGTKTILDILPKICTFILLHYSAIGGGGGCENVSHVRERPAKISYMFEESMNFLTINKPFTPQAIIVDNSLTESYPHFYCLLVYILFLHSSASSNFLSCWLSIIIFRCVASMTITQVKSTNLPCSLPLGNI